METALALAAELTGAAPQRERADAWLLEQISRACNSEFVGYTHHGESSRLFLHDVEYPAVPGVPPWVPTDDQWDAITSGNPFCLYANRTGDRYFTARRVTDVADMRQLEQTRLFEMVDFGVMPHEIQMRLPDEVGHWTLAVARSGRNFDEREILLLNVLRPFVIAYESHRALAARVAALQAVRPGSVADGLLSSREKEVMDLVAAGATNAEIAERLWISPGTVRKHLEHIYLKLDVGSRTAALSRTGRSSGAPAGDVH